MKFQVADDGFCEFGKFFGVVKFVVGGFEVAVDV